MVAIPPSDNTFERALVVGGGSIGLRHLKNLRSLGAAASLGVVEPSAERRAMVAAEIADVIAFDSLSDALDWAPRIAVVASPTHLHVEQALVLARRNIPVLVEKPLSHSADLLGPLIGELRARQLPSLVGCNMRFHPGPAQIKRLVDDGAVGAVHFARLHCGSYLPDWRPWQDYRTSYSAHSSMGGGVILDSIHEIDLACWLLGPVDTVFCVARHLSPLELDVEDLALLVLSHRSGKLSEIHLDYLQRTYERGCQVVGEHGTVFWDFRKAEVRLFDARQDKWTVFAQPRDWHVNQMYVDEMVHFLDCVHHGHESMLPISHNVHVMRVAIAAKRSSADGHALPVRA